MIDTMEIMGTASLVEHGPGNDMAYLMSLDLADAAVVIDSLEKLASSRGYSKLFAKVPASEVERFVAAKYFMEGAIPGLFPEGDALYFMAKYLGDNRKAERQPQLVRQILASANAQERVALMPLPAEFNFRVAMEGNADEMAEFFSHGSQPGKLDAADIRATMEYNTVFYGFWKDGAIVALCSAEIDLSSSSAELANLVIQPAYRGQGLTLLLLQQVEANLLGLGVATIFATVRSCSFRNISYARNGYSFGGTLTNHICGDGVMESVNLWHKSLLEDPAYTWKSFYGNGSQGERSIGW